MGLLEPVLLLSRWEAGTHSGQVTMIIHTHTRTHTLTHSLTHSKGQFTASVMCKFLDCGRKLEKKKKHTDAREGPIYKAGVEPAPKWCWSRLNKHLPATVGSSFFTEVWGAKVRAHQSTTTKTAEMCSLLFTLTLNVLSLPFFLIKFYLFFIKFYFYGSVWHEGEHF